MAAGTWTAMLRGSMPAWAALDRVQDTAVDRDTAAQATLEAAANDFQGRMPKEGRYLGMGATAIVTAIRLRRLVEAETLRDRGMSYVKAHDRTVNDWIDWYHDLRRAIRLCGELVAATSPAPSEAP